MCNAHAEDYSKIILCYKAIDSDDGVPCGKFSGAHDVKPVDKNTGVAMNLGASYKGSWYR